MDRREVVQWLRVHPNDIQGNPENLIVLCEKTVRRHAAEEAWHSAKAYVEKRKREWEKEWGTHAGETFVAKEICVQLAYELKHHEPKIEIGDEESLVDSSVQDSLTSAGWLRVSEWVREVAQAEEHEVWCDIVRFTGKRGAQIAHDFHLKDDSDYDHTRNYPEIAAEVAGILADEYERHAQR